MCVHIYVQNVCIYIYTNFVGSHFLDPRLAGKRSLTHDLEPGLCLVIPEYHFRVICSL